MVVATNTPGLWGNTLDQCPHCGHQVNGIGELNEETDPPVPGDFTICIRCAGISVLGPLPHLLMRKPNPGELEQAYAACPRLQREHARAVRIIQGMQH